MVTLLIVRFEYQLNDIEHLLRSVHQSHELSGEAQRLRCHLVARPEFSSRLCHEPAGKKHIRKTLGNVPPACLVGHGEIITFFSTRHLFSLQNLPENEDVVLGQV